jgi:dihydroxyacetone kinase
MDSGALHASEESVNLGAMSSGLAIHGVSSSFKSKLTVAKAEAVNLLSLELEPEFLEFLLDDKLALVGLYNGLSGGPVLDLEAERFGRYREGLP